MSASGSEAEVGFRGRQGPLMVEILCRRGGRGDTVSV